MRTRNKKILIIGHGLAGAVLAHQLLWRDQDVYVIDANSPHAASKVSAGLINPFIGPKLNTPQDYNSSMNANNEFFGRIRKQYNKQFLHSIDLVRIFQNPGQKERWHSLSPQYRKQELSSYDCKKHKLLAQYGGGITRASKLDSTDFVNFSRSILLNHGRYSEGRFNNDIKEYRTVIFSEGFRVIENPWFNWLPFAPAEGEVLELNSKIDAHVSNGTWHLPRFGKSTVLAGSTWNHDLTNLGPTIRGKKKILENLSFISSQHYFTINHISGVRSGTIDREPILGRHPEIRNFYLFNGFGSRGSTNIAKCAREMADLVLNNIPIKMSKNLSRFI